ncbi:hypothetical protein FJ970_25335 [Mesorhizobium sp. B2-1-8]|uniref:hypothetical protein n=1 Tax=unclassified Mesorhizobium TaxID=325217 RepID=UPI001CC93B19|nr:MULTISPECIES: hypothetical protein [unclassified Mesorhizobium]UCI18372.1 hypothetical protein FJ970_25335 [Mesorhizobium sp. B2-1-8]
MASSARPSRLYEYSLAGPERPDLLELTKPSDLGPPTAGKLHARTRHEDDHFYNCPRAAKRSTRDLRQVMWHKQPNHEPLEQETTAKVPVFPRQK